MLSVPSPALLDLLNFPEMVFLREASHGCRQQFKVADMMRIMRKRLPDALYSSDAKSGQGHGLMWFMKEHGWYLSGSAALGFIMGEQYLGDIDMFYHSNSPSPVGREIGYDETNSFYLLKNAVDYYPFYGLEVIRNNAHRSKLTQHTMHDIITQNFDLSCVKNTVAIQALPGSSKDILTIEISDRNTLLKRFTIDKRTGNRGLGIRERVKKYEDRGFHLLRGKHETYTCSRHKNPVASIVADAIYRSSPFSEMLLNTTSAQQVRAISTMLWQIDTLCQMERVDISDGTRYKIVAGMPVCELHCDLARPLRMSSAMRVMMGNFVRRVGHGE